MKHPEPIELDMANSMLRFQSSNKAIPCLDPSVSEITVKQFFEGHVANAFTTLPEPYRALSEKIFRSKS